MAGRVRRALLTAALVAVLAAAPTATAGAAGLVADETLSTTAANVPALAMAPNGYAILAWTERPAAAAVVRVSLRPPGGSWSAPQTFPVGLEFVSDFDVAIASSGAAAIAWEEVTSPSTFQIAVATRLPGAQFGAPELLTDGRQTLNPAIGIDASGGVTLLYTPSPDTVVRDFAAGASVLAASPEPISPGCSAFGQQLAVAPSGDAVAGYDCSGAVFALRRGGRWAVSPKVDDNFPGGTCSSSTDYQPASVAIDAAGSPVGVLQSVFQQRSDFGLGCQTTSMTVSATLVLPLAGLMTPVPGPPAVTESAFGFGFVFSPLVGPSAAGSPDGIVLAWGDVRDSQRAVPKVRFYAPDGSGGSAPQTVGSTPGIGNVFPVLAVAADGSALLAWTQVARFGEDAVALVAERPPGGSFGEPVPVSAPGADALGATVEAASGGDGVVAWIRNENAPYELHVRGYDASAPTLSGVAIPPTASAGVPASFAASAFDLWGPVTVRWAFGDGATATGPTAQHAYAAPGRYAVSVVATDAVGLSGPAQTGTVLVAGGAPGGPPALSGASVRPATFRVGRAATAVSAARRRGGRRRARAAPVGTTFRFTLDRAATVTIAFARQASGLRAGRGRGARCARPSRRLARARARRCTRWIQAGSLTRRAAAGAGAVPFSGRVGRRALAAGRYRATLTPAADGRAGTPRALSFRVVR